MRAYAFAFFSILTCFELRDMCGKWSEYGKDDKLPYDRDMCIFPAIKTGTHSSFRFHQYGEQGTNIVNCCPSISTAF